MEKESIPYIDFSEFPDPDSEAFITMSDEDFESYEISCEYIQIGTSVPVGTKVESGFFCRQEMADGELCDGSISVTHIEEPNQVRWECRKCGDTGAVFNHENSIWDNSHLSDKEKELFLEHLFSDISGEDYFEDEFYDLQWGEQIGPLFDFEYFTNLNDRHVEKTGELTSEQIKKILDCDWTDPKSSIYLKDNLTYSQLKNCIFFYNALEFLSLLTEEGEFHLTNSGLLKRRIVRKLIDRFIWPEQYLAEVNRSRNNPDETDVWLMHGVRILLDLSELIKQSDKSYRLNENLLHLLDEENAGELYRLLFSTYFKEMNLGYLGSTIELPHLQYSVPYILYKLQNHAKSWVPVEKLIPDILLYSVTLELNLEEADNNIAIGLLYDDLFNPLEHFSLIETRQKNVAAPIEIRITSLFDAFIEFNLE